MKTMYQVTCVNKQGMRTLISPAQGRHMHDTRDAAERWLGTFLENNSTDRLESIYGPQAVGTFRVDAFECYDHGDPIGIYVDEDQGST